MVAAIPYIVTAVGAAVKARNDQVTADKQDRSAAAGITQQAADQRKADAAVNAQVQKVGQSTPEAARDASLQSFLTQLQQSRAQATGGGNEVGGSRFATDKVSAGKDINDFGDRTAALLARINAPGIQRQQEQQGFQQLSSDLGATQRQSQGDLFLSQLRQRGIQPNPWANAAGSLLEGAGQGYAGYSGTKPPKTPKPSGSPYYDGGAP